MGESVTGDTKEGPKEEKEEAASLQAGYGAEAHGKRRKRKRLGLQCSSSKVAAGLAGSPGAKACRWRGSLSSQEEACIRTPSHELVAALRNCDPREETPLGRSPTPVASKASRARITIRNYLLVRQLLPPPEYQLPEDRDLSLVSTCDP